MEELNEGLGTVYEKLMLNDLFEKLIKKYNIKSILEAPIWGMSGIPGMNSFIFSKKKLDVTLLDNNRDRINKIKEYWKHVNLNPKIDYVNDFSKLPLDDNSYDLVWNFSALWYHKNADKIVEELVRVSKNLVLISVTNRWQPGYFMRKFWLDKDFFKTINEEWTSATKIKKILKKNNIKIIDESVIDVPPFPDTCMPIGDLLKKLGIKQKKSDKKNTWHWTTMKYYSGIDDELPKKIAKYTFIEKFPIPWQMKIIWSHHHYILGQKIEKNSAK